MRYHLTPVRMAITKMSTKNKWWRWCGEKGMLLHCWWKCKFDTASMDGMEIPLNTRNKTIIWPSNPTPRHIPWGNQIEKNTRNPLFIATLFTIARIWKQPRCPSTDEWIKKLWYIDRLEYYSAIKRNAFESVLVRWMNLESIIQGEVSQKEKDKYHILVHRYGI